MIVGAGHAGGSVAILLRQAGYEGRITLIGEEPTPPYQRPPLSKGWLKGEVEAGDLLLKPEAWWPSNDVDLRLGVRAIGVDLSARTVLTEPGGEIAFDQLVLATGARARSLPVPGAELYGVLSLRDARDAEALRTSLGPGRRLAIIGGGYVGLEAAASTRGLGAEAVVLEREPRLLARVAAPELAAFFTARHRAHGVTIELGAQVEAIEGEDGRVAAVRLRDGRRFGCDAALVGVGAQPNDELARAAGLHCQDGVVVDETAAASHPAVWAVGDVSRRPLPQYGRLHRLESVPNAPEQAKQVVAALTGRPAPAAETPWFWSDQYDIKLQIAGLPLDCDRRVVRGDPTRPGFAVFHLKDSAVRAAEAVNAPAEFMAARQLIARATVVDAERLADPDTPMRSLLTAPGR